MNFYLPDRDECREIVKETDSFYVIEKNIEGQNVEIYNYRLASLSDFIENRAFELRGLTFTQDGGEWKRHLVMQKFFNINQTDGWLEEDVNNKKITRVQDKLDGSVITFIRFSNDNIRAKSKMSFDSEQAMMAQDIFMNSYRIRKFITTCLNTNHTPIFELVGYNNSIVLSYDIASELRLLHIRRDDGTYLNREEIHKFNLDGINVTTDYDIDKLENIAKEYSRESIICKIGDQKFNTFSDMLDYLQS